MRRTLILFIGLFLSAQVLAHEAPAGDNQAAEDDGSNWRDYIPDIDLYPAPQVPTPKAGDRLKSCVTLDDEIVALTPLTYRTVPDFYDDPYNAAAIWLGTAGLIIDVTVLDVPLWYGYLGYPGYKKYKESERIRRANLRIEALRRVKARKRCFET